MHTVELLSLVASFAGIVWGVLWFFVRANRTDIKTSLLSVMALGGFANQARATWRAPDDWIHESLAVLLYATSTLIFCYAVRACARRPLTAIFTQDAPVRIVTSGPYRFVRHPFYLSYSCFWIAGWAGTGEPSTGAIAAGMVVLYVTAARSEEAKFAASTLADAYERYRRRTGLLVPRIRT